jgi:hypothetical protein
MIVENLNSLQQFNEPLFINPPSEVGNINYTERSVFNNSTHEDDWQLYRSSDINNKTDQSCVSSTIFNPSASLQSSSFQLQRHSMTLKKMEMFHQ